MKASRRFSYVKPEMGKASFTHCLVLGGGGHMQIQGEMVEKGLDFFLSVLHVIAGFHFMKQDEAFDPRAITPTLQKSMILQIQGVKGEVVVIYCEPLATQEMWYHRFSLQANNMPVFTIFWMSLGVYSTKAEKSW